MKNQNQPKITLITVFVDSRENCLHAQYSIDGKFYQEVVPLEGNCNEL